MPVLVDSSLWVHQLRKRGDPPKRDRVNALLESGEAAWCPVVRLELWRGVTNDAERKTLRRYEALLPDYEISAEVWTRSMQLADRARASGVTAKMIRHYESLGLIAQASRSDGGYRQYGPRDVSVLRFIRQSRSMGFSIKQIEQLLGLWADTRRESREVMALAREYFGKPLGRAKKAPGVPVDPRPEAPRQEKRVLARAQSHVMYGVMGMGMS